MLSKFIPSEPAQEPYIDAECSPSTAVYLQCIVLTTFSEFVSKFGKDHSYVIAMLFLLIIMDY
jgi:hypothetical protein